MDQASLQKECWWSLGLSHAVTDILLVKIIEIIKIDVDAYD